MKNDFTELAEMKYSGRTVGLGMTPNGTPFTLYALTGRRPSSQARKLEVNEKGNLKTVLAEEPLSQEEIERINSGGKIKNADLIFYPAMIQTNGILLASNGLQIGPIFGEIQNQLFLKGDTSKINLNDIMDKAFRGEYWVQGEDGPIDILSYEPDKPNYTPRIDAVLNNETGILQIIKKTQTNEKDILRYNIELQPTQVYFLTTYKGGNESPLLSFDKADPLLGRVHTNKIDEITEYLYEAISNNSKTDENFAVSSAVMTAKQKYNKTIDSHLIIQPNVHTINRWK